ncbi:hypothetical protein ACS0TY_025204 [Phlomoides rotata]
MRICGEALRDKGVSLGTCVVPMEHVGRTEVQTPGDRSEAQKQRTPITDHTTPAQFTLGSQPIRPPHPDEVAALRKEMEMIKRRCDTMGTPALASTGSPFLKEILSDPLPNNFKALAYKYDGTSDPHDHLLRLKNGTMLHQYTDGS